MRLLCVGELREALSITGFFWSLAVCGIFVVALFLATIVLPGKWTAGQPLPDGSRRHYRLNGLALFVATHMFVFVAIYKWGFSLSPLLRNFWSLLAAANFITLIWLVCMLRAGAKNLRPSQIQSSNWLSKIWYGIELNPSFMGVDLKVFAYQPSLIGLGVLNLAFANAQYEALGTLTPQMLLYQFFWWAYLLTHYIYEAGVISMWDVIAEKFGFMLLWGDLVLVPFFYCIGGWILLEQKDGISIPYGLIISGFFALGLWIFRQANAQKNRFKNDKNTTIWGRPARALGGKLLVSGWWGYGRKINYTGEIMVYTSFALTTGFHSIIPYLLPLWLCCLLPHRAWRDEQRCAEKYGELWQEYTKVARFRMIPFVY